VKLVKDLFNDDTASMFYRESLYLKAGYGPKYYGLVVDRDKRFLGFCIEAYESSLSKLTFEPCHEYLFVNVVKQLTKMHHKKIVHCDIKQGNILLRSNDFIESCITDFGISGYASDGGPSPSRFYDELYTPSFRPPELLFGLKYLTTSADIWALGMTMYFTAFCSDSKTLHYIKAPEILGFLEVNLPSDSEKRLEKIKILGQEKGYSLIFLEAMSACLNWIPEQRPNAIELYDLLKELPKEKAQKLQFRTKEFDCKAKTGLFLHQPSKDFIYDDVPTEKTMKNLCVIGGLDCNKALIKLSQENFCALRNIKAPSNQLVLCACLFALYEVRDSRTFKYQWSSKLVSMTQLALENIMAQCFVALS
jgi:serine/threonine protein kinase